MAREGDRLTIRTHAGDARIERTAQGVVVQMPSQQTPLSPSQAQQIAAAVRTLSRGGQQQGRGQQSQFQQQGSQGSSQASQQGSSSDWSRS